MYIDIDIINCNICFYTYNEVHMMKVLLICCDDLKALNNKTNQTNR